MNHHHCHDTLTPAAESAIAEASAYWSTVGNAFPTEREQHRRLRLLVAFARKEGAPWGTIAERLGVDADVLRDHIGCIPRYGRKGRGAGRGTRGCCGRHGHHHA